MKVPTPKRLDKVLSDRITQFKLNAISKKKYTKGKTNKGRLSELKSLDPNSKRANELRKEVLNLQMFMCSDCDRVFRFASERNQHRDRAHRSSLHYVRLNTRNVGFRCLACGPGNGCFKDQRGLKRHYLDRKMHDVTTLLDCGIRLWAFGEVSEQDKDKMREYYETK